MRHNTETLGLRPVELAYFAIAVLLLLILGIVANGQTRLSQAQQPLYREYRGVRLGMTAAEARVKLGVPAMMSDEQDYVFSTNETAQIVYAAQKVVTISTDYTGGIGAPDYKSVVGQGLLLERPDGSLFRMVLYDSERFWVSYNKSTSMLPVVTITIAAMK